MSPATNANKLAALLVVLVALLWAGMGVDAAKKGCGLPCHRDDDCPGDLFCNENAHCADDPELGTHECSAGSGNEGDESPGDSSQNLGGCTAKSFLTGTGHSCNQGYDAECCQSGTRYPQFQCSPKVTAHTPANLTVNDFGDGGDGGGASACDGRFHDASERVVALSTGWFDGGRRCNQKIRIFSARNGKSVEATVVDECDSLHGCDHVHDFQPPCDFDIVDASGAVWEELGISKDDPEFGFTQITWTDAMPIL